MAQGEVDTPVHSLFTIHTRRPSVNCILLGLKWLPGLLPLVKCCMCTYVCHCLYRLSFQGYIQYSPTPTRSDCAIVVHSGHLIHSNIRGHSNHPPRQSEAFHWKTILTATIQHHVTHIGPMITVLCEILFHVRVAATTT